MCGSRANAKIMFAIKLLVNYFLVDIAFVPCTDSRSASANDTFTSQLHYFIDTHGHHLSNNAAIL